MFHNASVSCFQLLSYIHFYRIKKHLKILLTFFWIAEVKKTFLGLHFQSKLVKANLDSALLGNGISVPKQ